ncbi:MAG TPA: hypothetical protein VEZ14_06205 [Dehalococcoidia bacterium]|nr:hypothetical protein [Dehalococcoidia bacterium]
MTTSDQAPGPNAPSGDVATSAFQRALSCDLTRPFAFAVLALAYVAGRAPFINDGFGTKPDAWRIALSGWWLWDRHEFYPSRLPGYPVAELGFATVIKGGWVASNSLTIAVSLLGLWFFAQIVRKLGLPNPALLVVGFAFQPLIWINTMNTMDYAWALTFILGSYYFLLQRHTSLAGVMLGLAIGSRLPSAAMLLPAIVYLWRDGKRGELRDLIVWSVFVPMVAFLPIVWRYGPSFLTFYDAKVGYRTVIRLLAKDSLGLAGALALGIGVVLSLRRLAKLPGDIVRDKDVMFWSLAVVLYAIIFFRLPHEAAYLLPLYPFAFLLIGRYFKTAVLAGVISVLLLANFVDFTTTNHQVALSSITKVRVGQGMLLANRDTMRAQLTFTHDLEQRAIPPRSVVMIGFSYPQFAYLNRNRLQLGILAKDKSAISQLTDEGMAVDPLRQVTYVWLLKYDVFQKYLSQEMRIYYTLDAGRSTQALYNFRPGLYDNPPQQTVQAIDLGRGPSGGRGTADTDR